MFTPRTAIVTLAALLVVSFSNAESLRQERLLQSAPANLHAEMLKAVNAERAKENLPPYCTNKKLQAAAQRHADDMAKNGLTGHTGSDGSSMSSRVKDSGFQGNGCAENVAAGQPTVADVINTWMNSPGHRKNIMGKYKYFGVGYKLNSDVKYKHFWTQDFGDSSSESCDDGGAYDGGNSTSMPPAPAPTPSDRGNTSPAPVPVPVPVPGPGPVPSSGPVPVPVPSSGPVPVPSSRRPRPVKPCPNSRAPSPFSPSGNNNKWPMPWNSKDSKYDDSSDGGRRNRGDRYNDHNRNTGGDAGGRKKSDCKDGQKQQRYSKSG